MDYVLSIKLNDWPESLIVHNWEDALYWANRIIELGAKKVTIWNREYIERIVEPEKETE